MLTTPRRGGHRGRIDLSALPIHPLLAAAYPVVFLFATNAAEQVTLAPLWGPLAAAVGGALVALAVGVAIACGTGTAAR